MISEVMREYARRYGGVPAPVNVDPDVVERVIAEHVEKGEPIPDKYPWYRGLPDDAVV